MGVICCIGLVSCISYGDSYMGNKILYFEAMKLSSTFTLTFHGQLHASTDSNFFTLFEVAMSGMNGL